MILVQKDEKSLIVFYNYETYQIVSKIKYSRYCNIPSLGMKRDGRESYFDRSLNVNRRTSLDMSIVFDIEEGKGRVELAYYCPVEVRKVVMHLAQHSGIV